MPAGSGGGTQVFNVAVEDDSAEYDDCLPEEVWELILSTTGTSVRKKYTQDKNNFVHIKGIILIRELRTAEATGTSE